MTRHSSASNQFLEEDGTLPPTRLAVAVDDWLPDQEQVVNALQFQFEPFSEEEEEAYPPDSVWFTSMRQGLGLVVVAGLIGGFIPFLVNWFIGIGTGTVVPLAGLVRGTEIVAAEPFIPWVTTWQAFQNAAGLQPALFPGWLAAGLSALGLWLNWPLSWLSFWIVYGAAVLVVAHWLGSPATLQRFYALTSYAALPLVLTGLGIIPCVGVLINLLAGAYALVIYIFGVRAATRLTPGRAILAAVAPFAVVAVVGSIVLISLVIILGATAFRFLML
jgi:hypothetical protein